ncbi:MAG: hypothetical protein ACK4RK_19090 [Gemmataceae bacterium]
MRGTVLLNRTGRPEIVYGKPCPPEVLAHEVWVTEAELLLGRPIKRGVRVGKAIADGLMIRDGEGYWIEVDNETMSTRQLREKWRKYGKVQGFILVICHSKARLRKLMKSAERVKAVTLFTRFRWLKARHLTQRWIDWWGHRV